METALQVALPEEVKKNVEALPLSPISSPCVQTIPHVGSEGNFQNVAQIFEVTLVEFALLWACRRDDNMQHALHPSQTTKADREILATLRERSLVWRSSMTGKWELTEAGLAIVTTAPLIAHCTLKHRRTKGEVLRFPSRAVGNSA